MEQLLEYIKSALNAIKNFIVKVINGVINFAKHIFSWFKNLSLNQKIDTPFILNANNPQFKEMLKNATVKDVGIFEKNVGIVEGVYNEEADEIIHHQYLAADELDEQTRNLLGNDGLVVLQ